MHARAELDDRGAIRACQSIEPVVQGRDVNRLRQGLGASPVVDRDEGVVDHPVGDTFEAELVGQEVVAVEVELEPERR